MILTAEFLKAFEKTLSPLFAGWFCVRQKNVYVFCATYSYPNTRKANWIRHYRH